MEKSMLRRIKVRRKMCIPGKRVSDITRCEVGMKKEVRLRRRFWKNQWEDVGGVRDIKERIFGCWMRRVEEASSGIYTYEINVR